MKRCVAWLLVVVLLLTGCTGAPEAPRGKTVACTTYPVYLLAQAVTRGAGGLEPVLVIDQQLSCLHDYTLTINDMKRIESSAVLAINGAGMEDFLQDVLEQRTCIDCSAGLDLLWKEEEEEYDPHFWLDPTLAAGMAENLAEGFAAADPERAQRYRDNAAAAGDFLADLKSEISEELSALPQRELITFHDGFAYFARAFDLDIVASVEEEEGSEASARRINELVELIDRYQLSAVFTEVNGSVSTAQALARERGIEVRALDLGMSRPEDGAEGLDAYAALLRRNAAALKGDGTPPKRSF